MARGRELAAQGVTGIKRHEMRWKEVDEGKVPIPREPRMLYVLTGSGFDAAKREVVNPTCDGWSTRPMPLRSLRDFRLRRAPRRG
jgi:hypothetical protein